MIPLSIPNLAGNEWVYVKDCLDTGWISSVGSYVTRFEQAVADFAGAQHGIAAVNGTAALHVALMLAGVKQGDAVIVPNLTFVASLNAIKHAGGEPVVIDVDAQTWQMDLDLLEEFLDGLERSSRGPGAAIDGDLMFEGRRVGAIMPVHVLGNICDMDRLVSLGRRFRLPIVEDSTEALGSRYNGRHAGTFGLIGTFSFNGNKIISTGGGGTLITDDPGIGARAKHLTTTAKRSAYEYFHDEVGYNYRLVNVLAAIGVAQMEQLPRFLARKRVVDAAYRSALAGVGDITFQRIPAEVEHNCWLHTIATERQQDVIAHLRRDEIDCRPFWVPMNRLPMYKHCHYVNRNDVAGRVYERCVSIPSSTGLTDDQVSHVIQALRRFFEGVGR